MCELPEKDISDVVVQCIGSILYNKLPWFVSELPEKDISDVVVQCIGSILYNKLPWFVSELYRKKISLMWWYIHTYIYYSAHTPHWGFSVADYINSYAYF